MSEGKSFANIICLQNHVAMGFLPNASLVTGTLLNTTKHTTKKRFLISKYKSLPPSCDVHNIRSYIKGSVRSVVNKLICSFYSMFPN